ncbi:pheromone alpha factor receptor [Candida albicans P76067]|nr:pheromone alpha factor receptor [Candida albicans P76067]
MNINSTFIPDKPGDIIISYSIPGLDQPIQIPFHSLDSFQTDQAKIALVMGITIGSCSMTLIFLISIMYKTNKLTNLKLNLKLKLKLKYILQWINQKIFTKKRNDNKQQQQQQQIESSSYNNTTTTSGGYKLFLFYLNSLILLIGIIRSGCYLNYNLGPLNSLSFVFTGWYDGSSFISSDVTNGFKCILYALVEISLGFQVYVMFKTSNLKIWGIMASLLSIGLGLIVVAFQINLTILSHIRFSRAISTNRSEEESSLSSSSSLSSDSVGYVINSIWMDLPTILFSISINIMTILLIGKLIFAIRTRRYLGLKQFDSFHILLIGFSQTLIIPSIILVVHYFYLSQNKDSLLQQISLLLIILMLPLSSLWAQTANNTHNINSSPSLSFISRHHSSDSSRSGGSNTIVSNGGSNGGGGGGGNFPVSGIDAQLPPDIEKILHEDNNYKLLNSNNESVNDGDIIINDEGMITKQITIKRV